MSASCGQRGAIGANWARVATVTWAPLATGTPTAWPDQFEGDAGHAGQGRGREDDLGRRLTLGLAHELPEGTAQVDGGDAGGPDVRRPRTVVWAGTALYKPGLGFGVGWTLDESVEDGDQ